jgi:hypothetical protein
MVKKLRSFEENWIILKSIHTFFSITFIYNTLHNLNNLMFMILTEVIH